MSDIVAIGVPSAMLVGFVGFITSLSRRLGQMEIRLQVVEQKLDVMLRLMKEQP